MFRFGKKTKLSESELVDKYLELLNAFAESAMRRGLEPNTPAFESHVQAEINRPFLALCGNDKKVFVSAYLKARERFFGRKESPEEIMKLMGF